VSVKRHHDVRLELCANLASPPEFVCWQVPGATTRRPILVPVVVPVEQRNSVKPRASSKARPMTPSTPAPRIASSLLPRAVERRAGARFVRVRSISPRRHSRDALCPTVVAHDRPYGALICGLYGTTHCRVHGLQYVPGEQHSSPQTADFRQHTFRRFTSSGAQITGASQSVTPQT